MHLRFCAACKAYTMQVSFSLFFLAFLGAHTSAAQRVHGACGGFTRSAHPARFTPEDKYSRHRVTIKQRYGLLPRSVGAGK